MPPQADPFAEFRQPQAGPPPRTNDPFAEFRTGQARTAAEVAAAEKKAIYDAAVAKEAAEWKKAHPNDKRTRRPDFGGAPEPPRGPRDPLEWDKENSLAARYRRWAGGIPETDSLSHGITPIGNVAHQAVMGGLGAADWFIEEGPAQVGKGLAELNRGEGHRARGAVNMLKGAETSAMVLGAPFLAKAAATAPLKMATTLLTTITTTKMARPAAEHYARQAGYDEDEVELIGKMSDAVAGTAGGVAGYKAGEFLSAQLAAKLAATKGALSWAQIIKSMPPTREANYTKETWNKAAPYMELETPRKASNRTDEPPQWPGLGGVVDAAKKAVRSGIEPRIKAIVDQFPNDVIDGRRVLAAVRAELGKSQKAGWADDGEAALLEVYPQLKGKVPLADVDTMRAEMNSTDRAPLRRTASQQHHEAQDDAANAAWKKARETLSSAFYDHLETGRGVKGVRELRDAEGAILQIRRNAESHLHQADIEAGKVARFPRTQTAANVAEGLIPTRVGKAAFRMLSDALLTRKGTHDEMLTQGLDLRAQGPAPRYPTVPTPPPGGFPPQYPPAPPRPAPPPPRPAAPPPPPPPPPGPPGWTRPVPPQRPPGTPYSPFNPPRPITPVDPRQPYGPTGPFDARQPVPPQGKVRPVPEAPVPPPAATGPAPVPAPPNPARITLRDQIDRARAIAAENPEMDGAEAMRLAKEQWPLTQQEPATVPARPVAPQRTPPAAAADPETALAERLRAAQWPEADIAEVMAARAKARTAAAAPVQAEPIQETPAPTPDVETPPVPKAPAELVDDAAGQQLVALSPERKAIAEKMVRELEYDPVEAVRTATQIPDEDIPGIVKEMADEAAAAAVSASPDLQPAGNAVAPPAASAGKKKDPRVVIGHRIDPHKPVREGGYEPIYSDDPSATPVPLINDQQRVMLERMWDDMDIFIPERGRLVSGMKAQRGVTGIDPGMGITDASSHYSHGAAGSPVSEDLRVLSGAKVSNVEYKQAIQELLDGKLPTNRKHTAALEAAQAYIERRSGFHPPTAPPRESTAAVPASDLIGPPKTDTLPTGEEQPRLPGDVGDVRDVDVETPEIDLPYSLNRPVSKAQKGKQNPLFGAEKKETLMAVYTLAPAPWLIFLDDAGIYIPNGQLAIYYAGTSTPAPTYTSASGVANPFPITLDGTGRTPSGLYLQPGLNYKFVLHEPMTEEPLDGGIIRSQDNVGATQATGSTLTISVPGTYLIDASSISVIEYYGAGDMTIRGLTGGVQGQGLTIQNLSGSTVWVNTSDPTAGPGNTLVNLVSVGPMPLVSYRSNAHYTYLSGEWRMGTYEMGNPIHPPFDAADYGATAGAGGTWAVDPGDVIYENFYLAGRTVSYSFYFHQTSITGAPLYLTRRLPYGWNMLEGNTLSGILATDAAATQWGLAMALMLDATHVRFERVAIGTTWAPSVNLTSIIGRVEILLA